MLICNFVIVSYIGQSVRVAAGIYIYLFACEGESSCLHVELV